MEKQAKVREFFTTLSSFSFVNQPPRFELLHTGKRGSACEHDPGSDILDLDKNKVFGDFGVGLPPSAQNESKGEIMFSPNFGVGLPPSA